LSTDKQQVTSLIHSLPYDNYNFCHSEHNGNQYHLNDEIVDTIILSDSCLIFTSEAASRSQSMNIEIGVLRDLRNRTASNIHIIRLDRSEVPTALYGYPILDAHDSPGTAAQQLSNRLMAAASSMDADIT
jgi:hypothetical protein